MVAGQFARMQQWSRRTRTLAAVDRLTFAALPPFSARRALRRGGFCRRMTRTDKCAFQEIVWVNFDRLIGASTAADPLVKYVLQTVSCCARIMDDADNIDQSAKRRIADGDAGPTLPVIVSVVCRTRVTKARQPGPRRLTLSPMCVQVYLLLAVVNGQ